MKVEQTDYNLSGTIMYYRFERGVIMFSATVLMIFALLVFLFGCMIFPMSDVATVITTITAIIGAFAIWFQMKRERDIKEAEFIMNYNTSFIENQEFVALENRLEEYRKAKENNEENVLEEIVNGENHQTIVNYLVYHEALAVFVKKGILTIDSIDDLFAYRFFLIMNNPEIQRKELCAEAQYYHGCFWLHKKWSEYRKKKNLYILLEETSLEKTEIYNQYTKGGR